MENVCRGGHRVTDLEKFPVRVSKDEAPVCRGVHRVTDLENLPVRVSKDEAPTPLPVVRPLFISPCYFMFLESCWVLGVLVFFVVFTLAFTTG